MSIRHLLLITASVASCALALPSHAQSDYPSRPVRMVVPLAAGGGVDLMARLTAQRLTEQLGQKVLVENQGGGGGTIAGAAVARSAPDGYTLLFQSMSSAVVNAVVYTNLKYDPINDFAAVSLAVQFPMIFVINPQLPAANMKEFIALLKVNPGKYSYGSSGVGTMIHLASELFKTVAGVDMVHVPYRGNSAVMADLLAGRVAMLIDGVPPQVSNISSGKVRALAVSTTARSPVLPNVPTMIESGLAGYNIPFWTAIFAPAKTPKAIIDLLAGEVGKAMKNPESVKRLAELGAEGVGSTAEQLNQFWHDQLALYRQIVKDSGLKLELK
ncbi:MAG: tripartite tricarboxylate transporter substrate binding protein [Betaproteobacteria bacterium]|nr:tripartite tricarboxylate transporter substrate binding protein [Betaproteobacteria bacterium]